MTKIINSQTMPQNSVYSEKKTKTKGFIRGLYAGAFAATPLSVLNLATVYGMRKASEINAKDSVELSIATQKALKDSGLAQKGVKVFKVNEVDVFGELKKMFKSGEVDTGFVDKFSSLTKYNKKDKKALNAFVQELKQYKLLNKCANSKLVDAFPGGKEGYEEYLKQMANGQMRQIKTGMNACFLPKANKVIIPDKHLQTSVFHEMGHALNANGNVMLKALQKYRPLASIIPSAVLLISLLNNRQKNSEKLENTTKENKIQNIKDGIKNNAGLITGLSMLPMLLEEGLASLRGQNMAKKLVEEGSLSKELFKKIKLTNLGGFASYATAILATVVACEVAIKVKDKIQEKYEAKQALKNEYQRPVLHEMKAHQG